MHRPDLRAAALLAVLLALPGRAAAEDGPAQPPTPPDAPYTPAISADQVLRRIAFLADDKLEGRESGTEGGTKTEEWVASEYARFGLEPLSATKGSPFTDVPMAGRPIPEQSWVEFGTDGAAPQRVAPEKGSGPFSFSASGEVSGPLVFAGFGISATKEGYDDYEGVDVKGKVVLVLRHGPGEKDPASPWKDPRTRAAEVAFSSKAKRAAAAGAAAILLVNDSNHPKEDGLPVEAGGESSPIPVVAVRRATADLLLAPIGKTLAALQAEIDADRKPRSRAVAGVNVRVKATIAGTSARNVVFVRRGTDPALRDEAVLLCAHMDHVGRGFFGSVAKAAGQIHNGADDNASGTAAVLEVAEALAAGPPMKRSVVFAAWCGEEKGLIGSLWFTEHPLWDLSKIAICVNLDMVGRYREATPKDAGLIAEGSATAVGTVDAIKRLAAAQKLRCTTDSWEAWEQSDHAAFYAKGVPSLFFHTGLHPDYHTPTDDWWKVPAEPEARIALMTADLVRELADAPARPAFAKKPPRPVLGVRLDDAPGGAGARLVAIVPGLGANAAGLQVNDVISRFGTAKITSASELSAAIQASKPDDVVEVEYTRAGKTATVKVHVSGM
jgi:hypothetical protein